MQFTLTHGTIPRVGSSRGIAIFCDANMSAMAIPKPVAESRPLPNQAATDTWPFADDPHRDELEDRARDGCKLQCGIAHESRLVDVFSVTEWPRGGPVSVGYLRQAAHEVDAFEGSQDPIMGSGHVLTPSNRSCG